MGVFCFDVGDVGIDVDDVVFGGVVFVDLDLVVVGECDDLVVIVDLV